ARIAADQARYGVPASAGGTSENSILLTNSHAVPAGAGTPYETASHAERRLALCKVEAKQGEAEDVLALLQAEQAIAVARRVAEGAAEKKEDKTKAEVAIKKLQEQVASARKAVETAQAALTTNSPAYTSLTPI